MDDKALNVHFFHLPRPPAPRPQEPGSVKVTGPAGNETPVPAAELLAYMYDRSLDAFAFHSPPTARPVSNPVWDRTAACESGEAQALWLSSGFNRPFSPPVLARTASCSTADTASASGQAREKPRACK